MNAEPEVDVVYGVMTSRKGGFAERTFGSRFYSAINLVSSVEIPRNVMNARLMRRRYVDALLQYRDVEPFLGGLMAHVGFRQLALPCEKGSRDGSSYTFRRKLRLALDALFGFSTVPLTAVAAMGWGIALAALLVGIFRIFDGRTESDAALLLWSMWFLGGAMLGSVGIVGMYVGRALAQARQRPIAVVKELYGFPSE